MVEKFIIEIAIDKFLFEKKYCILKPNRDTVKWSNGDHVSLYDQYVCKIHKLVITTYDDDRYIPGNTVFCPVCNENIMKKDIEYPHKFKVLDDKEFKEYMKFSKSIKRFYFKQNLEYKVKRFFKSVKNFLINGVFAS